MKELSDHDFEALIARAMDELPQEYISNMQNVVVVTSDAPNEQQQIKLKLRGDQLLLGLYEGVPRILQTGNESGLLPSKITLFKYPIMAVVSDEHSLFEQIKRTLWHEIAHYYGLDHGDIDRLQLGSRKV